MTETPTAQSLFVIWTSADPETARNMAFMYANNSLLRGWWDRVRLIIWGPSARLAAQDEDILAAIRELLDTGVEVWACRACADNYGVSETLEQLGVEVVYVGEPVTRMLKEGWTSLTV